MYKNIKKLIGYSEGEIRSNVLVKNNKLEVTLFCMAKDTEIGEHTSTKQGLVYVVEGQGVFNLEGEEIPMREGTFIQMDENAVHSLKVEENTSFILTLVK